MCLLSLHSAAVIESIRVAERIGEAVVLEAVLGPQYPEEALSFADTVSPDDLFPHESSSGRKLVLGAEAMSVNIDNINFHSDSGLLSGFTFEGKVGSLRDPSVRVDSKGREIQSSLLTFWGTQKLRFSDPENEKTSDGKLLLRFRITPYETSGARVAPDDEFFSKYLSVGRAASARPFAPYLGNGPENNRRKELEEQLKRQGTHYATTILQLRSITADEASNLLQSHLSPDGKIVTAPGSEQIIVTDRADYLLNAVQVIERVDRQPPQVLIEVKVVEVQRGDSSEIGVNWSGGASDQGRSIEGQLNTFTDAESASSQVLTAASPLSVLSLTDTGSKGSVTAKISALIEKGRAKVMSEPRLMVAHASEGSFKLTTRHPILVRKSISLRDDSSSETSSESNNSARDLTRLVSSDNSYTYTDPPAPNQSVSSHIDKLSTQTDEDEETDSRKSYSKTSSGSNRERRFEEIMLETGIELKVTPHVRRSGVIELNLQPVITEMSDNPNADTPSVSTRQIQTRAFVKDGGVLVLGGLIYEKEVDSKNHVPVLSKIPLVNRLFRSRSRRRIETELIFLVRTTILQL